MPAPANLVHELSTTTGTGNLTLANVNGKNNFNDAFGTGGTDTFDYFISSQSAAEWERGTGHLSDATTLVRDTVLESTNSDAAVNFSAGTKDVTNDVPAALQVYLNSDGGIDLSTNDGIDINPGSDADADLLTVGVTGAPTFSWDESSNQFRSTHGLIIGATGDGAHTIAGVSIVSNFEIHSEGGTDPGGLSVHRHADSQVLGGHALFLKSRGTHASPTVVADNDILAWLDGLGYDGTDYESAAAIQFLIDGTPGNNDMPGEIAFFTNAGSQTLTRRMSIRADGSVEIVSATLTLNGNAALDVGDINASVQAFDADTLKADTPDTLTAGFAHTVDNDGTQSTGTYTPDQDGGNMKRIVNGGAFTLAPPTDDCCIIVQITNNASAGAITTSGFTGVFGDAFTTTDGDDFICTIIKINGFSSLTVQDVS
jgi:hypothetical protein